MSDGDDPGTESENRGTDLGPDARDFEAELAERRRERFGATAADVERRGEADAAEGDGELLTPPESDAVEVDDETARAFWATVVYVNVGLFLLVLGPLLAYFRGRTLIGAAAAVIAAFAFYRSWTIYRAFRSDDGETAEDGVATDETKQE
ncbi:MAG: hypothetical protein ABEH90_03040 [Halolamina sp.]